MILNSAKVNVKDGIALVISFVILVLPFSFLSGQTVKKLPDKGITVHGVVFDENGEAMPFVNIYIKGTTKGTTTNIDGRFSLKIPAKTDAELVFQYVGYKNITLTIPAGTDPSPIEIEIYPEKILLKETVITASREDPAYPIIRNAIKMRKYYLNQVNSYSTKMYMKSNVTLDEIPEKFFLLPKKDMPDSTDLGLVYLSESVSIYNFKQPNNQKEEMIASKVSGEQSGYSFNRADIVLLNFYNNLIGIGFSERGFISPIAYNALFYYKYRLIDSFKENEYLIHKIEVIPKRRSDNVFVGYIYIIDQRWSIHSLDLMITKHSQVEFIDSIKVRQLFIPANDTVWMPISLHFVGYFKLFGFRASTNFISFFTEYEINKEFPEKYFNNEVFSVTEESTGRDSVYWENMRQIVLTEEEVENYKKGDSLLIVRESKEYQDSVNKVQNKFKPLALLWGGYSYNNWFKKYSWGVNSVIGGLASFNTVEGLSINIKPWYRKTFENKKRLILNSSLKYSFTSRQFNSNISARYDFDNFTKQYITISGGKHIFQYGTPDPISDFFNSIYTLFLKENYAKYYRKAYFKTSYGREITNGLNFTAGAGYARRQALVNSTGYSLIKYPDKQFTSNNPLDKNDDSPAFETNDALIIDVGFVIRFKQKYAVYPDRKVVYGSKYPVIRLGYTKGTNISGNKMSFDQWEIEVFDNISFKQLGTSTISLCAGGFFNKESVYFLDYKHFRGNQTIFLQNSDNGISIGAQGTDFSHGDNNSYEALEYYSHSTDGYYFQANYEHHFNGWIINKLPLIRKSKVQVVAGMNFLYTDVMNEYIELYAGLEHIFKVFRIDVVTKHDKDSGVKPGLRIGFGF